MSQFSNPDQFRTLLKCGRCGAGGHAVWEDSAANADGPMGSLVSMSENFFLQTRLTHQGQPMIACKACGAVQPD
jgi:hypothetical protein